MHRMAGGILIVGFGAWTLATTGCSDKEVLSTSPVQGVVTLDGQPVPEALVTFVPVAEGRGMSATGSSDAQGVYRLTAVGLANQVGEPGAGTLPGEYYVGVRKADAAVSIDDAHSAAQEGKDVGPKPGQTSDLQYVVPEKYSNPRQSGITVTVTEGENNIPLDLTAN